jgi:hypothetical protein
MLLFTAAAQAEQLSLAALVASSIAADDINNEANNRNLRLNLFNGVIAKTPLCYARSIIVPSRLRLGGYRCNDLLSHQPRANRNVMHAHKKAEM